MTPPIRPLGVPLDPDDAPRLIRCPDCNGNGEVPWTPRGRPVYSCGKTEMLDCRRCRGTGEIPQEED